MDLVWTVAGKLSGMQGHVVVAELTGAGSSSEKVAFCLLPPPVDVDECQSDAGEDPPERFSEWGSIFDSRNSLSPGAVFYRSAKGRIKYLRMEQKIVFDDRQAAPIQVSGSAKTGMPELVRQHKTSGVPRRWDEYPYQWVWLIPAEESP